MKRRNSNWTGHILLRYSVLKYVVEVMTEVTRRRRRRRRGGGRRELLLGGLKEIN
jgi:hypothetical protein